RGGRSAGEGADERVEITRKNGDHLTIPADNNAARAARGDFPEGGRRLLRRRAARHVVLRRGRSAERWARVAGERRARVCRTGRSPQRRRLRARAPHRPHAPRRARAARDARGAARPRAARRRGACNRARRARCAARGGTGRRARGRRGAGSHSDQVRLVGGGRCVAAEPCSVLDSTNPCAGEETQTAAARTNGGASGSRGETDAGERLRDSTVAPPLGADGPGTASRNDRHRRRRRLCRRFALAARPRRRRDALAPDAPAHARHRRRGALGRAARRRLQRAVDGAARHSCGARKRRAHRPPPPLRDGARGAEFGVAADSSFRR
ncbi:hypothetical protein M885DRAFT_623799, partial [Pelagophyceae sp. CCMP2097]